MNLIVKFLQTILSAGTPGEWERSKEANGDLRTYLTQIVEALRWTKHNQNRTSILVISTEVALMTKQAEAIFSDELRVLASFILGALLTFLLFRVYPRTQKQLRLREITVFEQLSPEAQAVLVFHETPHFRDLPKWREKLAHGMEAKRREAGSYLKRSDLFFTLVPFAAVLFMVIYHLREYYVGQAALFWISRWPF